MSGKRIYTDQERLERKHASQKKYYERKRQDPAFLAKQAAGTRARYQVNKNNPDYVKKVNANNLRDYYTKVRPFEDEMNKRRTRICGYQQKRRVKFNEKKIELQQLLGGKCQDCGIDDPRLLDFDHVKPAEKTMVISQNLHLSMELLIEELKLCELRCPNCHRLKTLERGGFSPSIRKFRNPQASRKSAFKKITV